MIKIQEKKKLADISTNIRIILKNVYLETSEYGQHRFYSADIYLVNKKIGKMNNIEAKNVLDFKNKVLVKIYNNIKI